MRIVSFEGGFGSLEGDLVQPFAGTLEAFLADPSAAPPDGPAVPLASLSLRAPVPEPREHLVGDPRA